MTEEKYFIGVDLGGTNIKAVAMNREGKIFHQQNIPTESEKGPLPVIDKLVLLIESVRRKKDVTRRSLGAIGVAVAGAVDMKQGICRFLTNFPTKWKGIPLASRIKERTGCTSFLINDVRAITLAEKTFGAGRKVKNLVCIALGTGIGGGIVIDGKLHFGSKGFAGEIGHQTISMDGPKCGCGNYGCFEALASGSNIASQAIRFIKQGRSTMIRDLVEGDLNRITPEVVAKAARQGDEVAREIWEKEACYVGIGIANLVVSLDPEMVIIGGGIAKAADLLFEGIKKELSRRVYVDPDVSRLKIVKSEFGDIAGAVGAATWAMMNVF
ncbi:ROK family protein [Candidatus Aerophobetes bacterium]|nr:ROK family protein [Candidatus Aerophobetes bacterium]